MKKIAAIGDIHGCITEFLELLDALSHHSLDEIWLLGDLVDRGVDSGAVVQAARLRGLFGIKGNHESTLIQHRSHANPAFRERERSAQSIRCEEDWRYLEQLPNIHVDDELNVAFVHGGVWPKIPLYKQPRAVMWAQMIQPYNPGASEWWGQPDEGELEGEGFRRWYEVCDHPQTIVYGHSVFKEPFFYNNTIGLDTGCVFGGHLTAMIFPTKEIIQVKAKKCYFDKSYA